MIAPIIDARHDGTVWLLPAFSALSRAGARVFYRLGRAGEEIPRSGPALLIANHPNSLLDPALVAAAAQRPVRFLAGSRTVAHPQIGWLIRAVGSIPVYRRIDDPAEVGRNVDTFRAAVAALADGAAIGIFPEGISLDDPHLQPIKTGAARLALSAVPECGTVPIIPVGLVYRDRDRFRSEALVVVGRPVDWKDLATRGTDDQAAVRELTRRIEDALRDVTINLERWEDAPIVDGAEAIWSAEHGGSSDPAHRVERLRRTTEVLARVRADGGERWTRLVRDVSRHGRLLRVLGLEPADLHGAASRSRALVWTLRHLPGLALGAMVLTLGSVLFWVPYRASAMLAVRTAPREAARSTHALLYGVPVFATWVALLSILGGVVAGWMGALGALIVLPAWALATVGARDDWRGAWRDVRRFLTLRRRRDLVEERRSEQREIAHRLDEALGTFEGGRVATAATTSKV